MASHLDIGKEGERLAEVYLADKGYQVLHRNWRHGRYEIDLVATKNSMLRFVEVKFRSHTQFGRPEEAVTKKKFKALMQAIEQYLYLHPQHEDFRLDVISIVQQAPNNIEYFLIEDVTM